METTIGYSKPRTVWADYNMPHRNLVFIGFVANSKKEYNIILCKNIYDFTYLFIDIDTKEWVMAKEETIKTCILARCSILNIEFWDDFGVSIKPFKYKDMDGNIQDILLPAKNINEDELGQLAYPVMQFTAGGNIVATRWFQPLLNETVDAPGVLNISMFNAEELSIIDYLFGIPMSVKFDKFSLIHNRAEIIGRDPHGYYYNAYKLRYPIKRNLKSLVDAVDDRVNHLNSLMKKQAHHVVSSQVAEKQVNPIREDNAPRGTNSAQRVTPNKNITVDRNGDNAEVLAIIKSATTGSTEPVIGYRIKYTGPKTNLGKLALDPGTIFTIGCAELKNSLAIMKDKIKLRNAVYVQNKDTVYIRGKNGVNLPVEHFKITRVVD